VDARDRATIKAERSFAGKEATEEGRQAIGACARRSPLIGSIDITPKLAKLFGVRTERTVRSRATGAIERLSPLDDRRRPYRELARLTPAKRITLQEIHEPTAFELALHGPADLWTTLPLRRTSGEPTQPGNPRDVDQHVAVVVALGQRHVTDPRAPAIVGTNAERCLGFDESR
jgi:hypothetical protein